MEISSTNTFPLAVFLCFFLSTLLFSVFLSSSVSLPLSYRVFPLLPSVLPLLPHLAVPSFLVLFFVRAVYTGESGISALRPPQPDREYSEWQRDAVIFLSVILFLKGDYKADVHWRRQFPLPQEYIMPLLGVYTDLDGGDSYPRAASA